MASSTFPNIRGHPAPRFFIGMADIPPVAVGGRTEPFPPNKAPCQSKASTVSAPARKSGNTPPSSSKRNATALGCIKEDQTRFRACSTRHSKNERPLVRKIPNNQPKKTTVKDRYHYDRYGNYKGKTSSEGPGGGYGLMFLLFLLPVFWELLPIAIVVYIGFLVFSWLFD